MPPAASFMSEDQKLIFAKLVREDKEILFGAFSPTVNHRSRDLAWKRIQDQMAAHGVKAEIKIFRKQGWENLRKNARRHYDQSKVSGAQGTVLSQVDEIVLDIIGRDNEHTTGLGKSDPAPRFKVPDRNVNIGASQSSIDSATSLMPPPQLPQTRRGASAFFDLNDSNSTLDQTGFIPPRSSSPFQESESLADQTLPSISGRTTFTARIVRSSETALNQLPAGTRDILSSAPLPKRRRLTPVQSILTDDGFKSIKKEVLALRRENLLKDQDEQELRVQSLRNQVEESNRTADLRLELLQLDVQARRSEIQRNQAMAAYYDACTKAVNENRLPFHTTEFTVLIINNKATFRSAINSLLKNSYIAK